MRANGIRFVLEQINEMIGGDRILYVHVRTTDGHRNTLEVDDHANTLSFDSNILLYTGDNGTQFFAPEHITKISF